MKTNPTRTLMGAVAVSVALLVSACGASGGSEDASADQKTTTTKAEATTTTTTAAEETTTTEAAVDDDAQARADSVDLTTSDFPDGWTATAPSEDDQDSPLKDCDPSFSDDDAKLAKHSTDDFSLGSLDEADGTQFAAETVVFVDAGTADAAVEVLNDADVVACLDEALQELLATSTGLEIEGALEDDDIGEIGTDNQAGVSATYVLTADDGSTVNATVALLAMSTGDVGTMVTILSLGDSLDPTTLGGPIQALADLQIEA